MRTVLIEFFFFIRNYVATFSDLKRGHVIDYEASDSLRVT